MESLISQRGKRLILYDDFKFRKSRKTLDGWLWRCTKKTCKSTLRLDDSETKIIKSEIKHNHEPAKNLYKHSLTYTMKKKVWENWRNAYCFKSGVNENISDCSSFQNSWYPGNAILSTQNFVPFITNFNDIIRLFLLDDNLGKHFLSLDDENLQSQTTLPSEK